MANKPVVHKSHLNGRTLCGRDARADNISLDDDPQFVTCKVCCKMLNVSHNVEITEDRMSASVRVMNGELTSTGRVKRSKPNVQRLQAPQLSHHDINYCPRCGFAIAVLLAMAMKG